MSRNMNSQSGPFPIRKHYLPLESNPDVFTELIHSLGVASSLEFRDVFSLDDPELLSLLPRPIFGLILIFPARDDYDKLLDDDRKKRAIYVGKGKDEPVIWFEQTIGNACGLYALLHCVCNLPENGGREYLRPNTPLSSLLQNIVPLAPPERALALEASSEIESAHTRAGKAGFTAPPPSATDNVEHHYVAFVSAPRSGDVYEMDGMKCGPLKTNVTLNLGEGEDLLSTEAGRDLIKAFIERERGSGDLGFSLMALVERT